jgi:hypothetical protein
LQAINRDDEIIKMPQTLKIWRLIGTIELFRLIKSKSMRLLGSKDDKEEGENVKVMV